MANPEYKEVIVEVEGSLPENGCRADMTLYSGELMLVKGEGRSLFDLISGMQCESAVNVRFCGVDWRSLGPQAECRMRGNIGRSFRSTEAWVHNMSLRENSVLRTLHHGILTELEADLEIERMAGPLELISLLDSRPEAAAPDVLARCQWMRAFIGNPKLVLLEDPEDGVPPGKCTELTRLVGRCISAGGAVVWAYGRHAPELKTVGARRIKQFETRGQKPNGGR